MITIYTSKFCRYREALPALFPDATITDRANARHALRCIPCAVIEDDAGIVGVVEWDETPPSKDDLSPERVEALTASRDARSEALASKAAEILPDPVDDAIAAVEAAKDTDTLKAATVAALQLLKGRRS